ncbi:MAG TPA: DUF5131 family protein [Telmatospirillum sp.]|nr:DUF5131 family protein [Telmatospirillum sp.]
MQSTGITWTNQTVNVAVGCDKVSEECRHCYAALDACRRADNPIFPMYAGVISRAPNRWGERHDWSGLVNYSFDRLKLIDRLKPGMCFVNSMSDSFHDRLPDEFIIEMFSRMAARPDVIFQVLTKRGHRLAKLAHRLNWSPNIWQGVTVGVGKSTWRLDQLREVPAAVRFVSVEPLIEPLDLHPWLDDGTLNWVIVGGESKSGWRPMRDDWVRDIRDACVAAGVPFFFKQRAGFQPEKHPVLDGRRWEQWPT